MKASIDSIKSMIRNFMKFERTGDEIGLTVKTENEPLPVVFEELKRQAISMYGSNAVERIAKLSGANPNFPIQMIAPLVCAIAYGSLEGNTQANTSKAGAVSEALSKTQGVLLNTQPPVLA